MHTQQPNNDIDSQLPQLFSQSIGSYNNHGINFGMNLQMDDRMSDEDVFRGMGMEEWEGERQEEGEQGGDKGEQEMGKVQERRENGGQEGVEGEQGAIQENKKQKKVRKKRLTKKPVQQTNNNAQPQQNDLFQVQGIIGKLRRKKKLYYLVKWKGFDRPEQNTWEEADNLSSVKLLIERYENERKRLDKGEGRRRGRKPKISREEGKDKEEDKDKEDLRQNLNTEDKKDVIQETEDKINQVKIKMQPTSHKVNEVKIKIQPIPKAAPGKKQKMTHKKQIKQDMKRFKQKHTADADDQYQIPSTSSRKHKKPRKKSPAQDKKFQKFNVQIINISDQQKNSEQVIIIRKNKPMQKNSILKTKINKPSKPILSQQPVTYQKSANFDPTSTPIAMPMPTSTATSMAAATDHNHLGRIVQYYVDYGVVLYRVQVMDINDGNKVKEIRNMSGNQIREIDEAKLREFLEGVMIRVIQGETMEGEEGMEIEGEEGYGEDGSGEEF